MKVINKETYTTTILTVECYGENLTIIHSESFMDDIIPEWQILNEDNETLDPWDHMFNPLIAYAKDYMVTNQYPANVEGSAEFNAANEEDLQAKELINLSGELLTYEEFLEYTDDYYNNPSDFDIVIESPYYNAIEEAATSIDPREIYQRYKRAFLADCLGDPKYRDTYDTYDNTPNVYGTYNH